jgi:hypothetical protein
MPAKNKSRVSDKQRAVIAAGRVQGKTAAVVASETGLSESTVRKQSIDVRTQTLIQELKRDAHAKRGQLQDVRFTRRKLFLLATIAVSVALYLPLRLPPEA